MCFSLNAMTEFNGLQQSSNSICIFLEYLAPAIKAIVFPRTTGFHSKPTITLGNAMLYVSLTVMRS